MVSCLKCKTGFTDTACTDQSDQPVLRQELGNLIPLFFPTDERRKLDWQVMFLSGSLDSWVFLPHGSRPEFSPANLFMQLPRLRLWIYIQLLTKEFFQSSILLDGSSLLVCKCIELHQLAVSSFIQGIEFDQALNIRNSSLTLVEGIVIPYKHLQNRSKLPTQSRSFGQRPFIEAGPILQAETTQKLVAVERGRILQERNA